MSKPLKPNEIFRQFEEELRKKGIIHQEIHNLNPSGRVTVGNLYRDPYSEKKASQ